MEYADLGSISNLVMRKGQITTVFPPVDVWLDVACQTLNGLQGLHTNNMQHNDLKPDNVLMFLEGDGRKVFKLADLGLGHEFAAGSRLSVTLDGCRGTRGYIAPESIERMHFSRASDVYSWACTMGYIATGKVPKQHQLGHPEEPRGFTVKELMKEGTPLPIHLAEKLTKCFSYERNERPTVPELIQYFK